MSRHTLKLTTPVYLSDTGQGAPVTELHFRTEVTAGDLRGIKASSLADPSVDDLLRLAGRLCGQPDAVMNRLSLADFDAVVETIGPFVMAGRRTPTTPSP